MVSLEPRTVMICVRATRSSLALKKGYRPLSSDSRITPADHMSIAGGAHTRGHRGMQHISESMENNVYSVPFCITQLCMSYELWYHAHVWTSGWVSDQPVPWLGHLVRTSGALKPGVPALGASCCFLYDIDATQSRMRMSQKAITLMDVLSRDRFTWTCRYCRHGQSDSSCRWGPAAPPAAACGCCSECGQKLGPCSPQTTFGWLRPQFCWVLSAK